MSTDKTTTSVINYHYQTTIVFHYDIIRNVVKNSTNHVVDHNLNVCIQKDSKKRSWYISLQTSDGDSNHFNDYVMKWKIDGKWRGISENMRLKLKGGQNCLVIQRTDLKHLLSNSNISIKCDSKINDALAHLTNVSALLNKPEVVDLDQLNDAKNSLLFLNSSFIEPMNLLFSDTKEVRFLIHQQSKIISLLTKRLESAKLDKLFGTKVNDFIQIVDDQHYNINDILKKLSPSVELNNFELVDITYTKQERIDSISGFNEN